MMNKQKIIKPERLRNLKGKSKGWINTRIVTSGFDFLKQMSHSDWAFYSFLCVVADKNGMSFYSLPKMEKLLHMNRRTLIKARNHLVEMDLIAVRKDRVNRNRLLYQVLSLPVKTVILERRTPKRQLLSRDEIQDIAQLLVHHFYDLIGTPSSSAKLKKGYKQACHLLEDGYSVSDINFTIEWAQKNVEQELYSFGIIPEVIGQALKDKEQSIRQEETEQIARMKRRKLETQIEKERKITDLVDNLRARMNPKELGNIRREAENLLLKKDPNIKKTVGYEMLLRIKEEEIIYQSYLKGKISEGKR